MGIWDYISGTTDSLKRNAPDLTPVKSWCSNSYGYSKATVSNVSGAVISNTGKVINQYWPSEETRSKIGPVATNVAKYSAEEGIKLFPGGVSALKVVKKSYSDAKKSENQTVDVKALQAKVSSLEKEVVEFKKLVKETGMMMNKAPSSDHSVVVGNQKPEDVIRVFMMKDFIGRQLLDDLIVTRPKKN